MTDDTRPQAPPAPPIQPIATQTRIHPIKSDDGIPMVAVTFLTALGSHTYFFEPQVAGRVGVSMQDAARKAPSLPTPLQVPGMIRPENN